MLLTVTYYLLFQTVSRLPLNLLEVENLLLHAEFISPIDVAQYGFLGVNQTTSVLH